MAAWSEGYFTDVPYTSRFFPQMAPGYLSFACLRQGVRPPPLGAGSVYLELGCGQGFGLNLMAAANPAMRFWGVDFHPGQIANAQRLARVAGLGNATFEDLSFGQLLERPDERLPRCDVIALHGVWSWVSPEHRGQIVRLIDRLLKPGGLAYVSYNAMPGWAGLQPLQHFVREHVRRAGPGDPAQQVVQALRAAAELEAAGAAALRAFPGVKPAIARALEREPAYLVHEYLHEGSSPSFFAEVEGALAEARLQFAATASVGDDILRFAAPAALQRQIQAAADPTWRETLLDYATNKSFRRDIFIRGRNSLEGLEREDAFRAVTLARLPSLAEGFEFTAPLGKVSGDPKVYGPILEALGEGPRSIDALLGLPSLARAGGPVVVQAISLLFGAGRIHPMAETADPGPARAFNRAVLAGLPYDTSTGYLAAPAVGTGVAADFPDRLAIAAELEGTGEAATAPQRGAAMLARSGARLVIDGEPTAEPARLEAHLAQRIDAFKRAREPLFRAVGVI